MHWEHDAALIYHWLVLDGLWRDVLAGFVAALITWLLAKITRLAHRLRNIEHLLDTSRPGGLTDVIHAINVNTTSSNQPDPPAGE